MSRFRAPSLEHLHIFTAVVDAGSFSAAARELDRSQPAVSYAVAAIEGQLGLTLFERGKRRPVLTPAGHAILAYARRIGQLADELVANAESLTRGLEGTLPVAIDSFFPEQVLCLALTDLAAGYPSTSVDVRILSRERVLQQVVKEEVGFGVSAIDVAWPPGIEALDFGIVEIIAVAAPHHELARFGGQIPTMVLRDMVQISNRSAGTGDETRDVSVNSSRVWRVNDSTTQLLLLKAGLGWGYLPLHRAQPSIEAGELLRLEPVTRVKGVQPWSIIFRAAQPPGTAGRYLAERIEHYASNQKS